MPAPLFVRFRTRLEDSLVRFGLTLPWWIPAAANWVAALMGLIAIAERHAAQPWWWLTAAGLLLVSTAIYWGITAEIVPQWGKALTVLGTTAMLLVRPVFPDFTPMLLVVLAAEMAVTTPPAVACAIAAAAIGLLVVAGIWFGLVGTPLFAMAVLFGLFAGFILLWYIRVLDAERNTQQAVRDQALLAERQRIAREVHDVVAHSLSITLLHLTGARRALQQDRDVDEAVAALTEAEQMGRSAMADVRRTVALLNETSAGTRPLPGAADIAELVDRTRAAGLDVRYVPEGEFTQVGAAAGLGLYRIAQESLANIVKHAPASRAELTLRIDADAARLTVRNDLPAGAARGVGAGLPGMSARAAQLGAELRVGPERTHWLVEVLVPRQAES